MEWPSSIVVKMGKSCGHDLDCHFKEKGRAPAASTKTHDVLDEAQKPTAFRTPTQFSRPLQLNQFRRQPKTPVPNCYTNIIVQSITNKFSISLPRI